MPNDLHNVMPGQPLPQRSASQTNAILATAREASGIIKRHDEPGRRRFPQQQNTQIWVRNQQPYAQAINNIYAIVAISTPVFDAGNSPEELQSFLFDPALDVTWPTTPASESTWGVALSPMNHSSVERAVVAGSCVARVSIDANPGDSVGVSNDAADQTADILVPTSGGAAIVVSVSSSQPDAYPGPPYKWAVIKFGGGGGGGGGSGGGTQTIAFQLNAADCHTGQAVGTVLAVDCANSSVQIGDTVDLLDFLMCYLTGNEILLFGRKGYANWMRDDSGYGYGCRWHITDICGIDFGC